MTKKNLSIKCLMLCTVQCAVYTLSVLTVFSMLPWGSLMLELRITIRRYCLVT